MAPLNPRVQRDELKAFIGKKVMIGTRSYHYLSGRFEKIRTEQGMGAMVAALKQIAGRVPKNEQQTYHDALGLTDAQMSDLGWAAPAPALDA